TNIRATAGEDRLVELSQLVRRSDQRVVDIPAFPMDLVDRPRGNWWLCETANVRSLRPGLLGERVAGRGEFIRRQLVETIDVGVDTAWCHASRRQEVGDRTQGDSCLLDRFHPVS